MIIDKILLSQIEDTYRIDELPGQIQEVLYRLSPEDEDIIQTYIKELKENIKWLIFQIKEYEQETVSESIRRLGYDL